MKDSDISLGTRMKGYESVTDQSIPYNEHMIIRLDGHKFSSFTKGFLKPFDDILGECMKLTCMDLVKEYGASTGFTGSDEITLVIPAVFQTREVVVSIDDIRNKHTIDDTYKIYINGEHAGSFQYYKCDDMLEDFFYFDLQGQIIDKITFVDERSVDKVKERFSKYTIKKIQVINEQIYAGRIQKISSLMSAFATVHFNKHFNTFVDACKGDVKRLAFLLSKQYQAHFDCRVYGVKTPEEAFNSVLWRTRDVEKNSKSIFAQSYCSHKSLLNKTGEEQIKFCFESTGKNYHDINDAYKYGYLVKKETYEKVVTPNYGYLAHEEAVTPKFGKSTSCIRTRVVPFVQKLDFSQDNVDLIMRKHK